MTTLSKDYIAADYKFPGTNTLVVLNGVYQPELSDSIDFVIKDQKLVIPKGVKVDLPIHLLFLTSKNCRVELGITLENDSSVKLIEEYAGFDNGGHSSEIEIKFEIKERGELVHYKLQVDEDKQDNYKIKTIIDQDKDSKVSSLFINKGSKAVADILQINLIGERSSYNVSGINLLSGEQSVSHQILIKHLAPECTSNVLSKGIVDDKAVNDFDCRVVAYSEAVKTETHVNNRNLLLSDDAKVSMAPELEIYVDEVICTHGATSGELDQDALFYLRSRGIAEQEAVRILTVAFAQEVLEKFSQYPRLNNAVGLAYD